MQTNLILNLKLKIDGSPEQRDVMEFIPQLVKRLLTGAEGRLNEIQDHKSYQLVKSLGKVTITDVHVTKES